MGAGQIRASRLKQLPLHAIICQLNHSVSAGRAQALLTGADEVLLDELGALREPKAPNTPECRIFRRAFSEITGERFDPHFHRPKFEILATKLRRVPHVTMRELLRFSSEQWDQKAFFESTFPYIEIGSVNLVLGRIAEPPLIPVAEAQVEPKC